MNDTSSDARREATIVNQRGLHARASAQLAKIAGRYQAHVIISTKSDEVSALSIMGMLMLAATKGTRLNIRGDGVDAEQAVAAIAQMIENGFEEEDFPGC
ncbi:MAG: HPr family phosphocarrier protein [Rhodospirillales bacterium]|nr:HPr family phosphocarrier protein [Rhodospirillales bacterium]